MKLNNCLNCGAHRDNRDMETGCVRHRFSISVKQAERYDWAINYIKAENKTGRHPIASLGSAGFTFLDDIRSLAGYAYGTGDKEFAAEICPETYQKTT